MVIDIVNKCLGEEVRVTVTEKTTKLPIRNVRVIIYHKSISTKSYAEGDTDKMGLFTFTAKETGEYRIEARKSSSYCSETDEIKVNECTGNGGTGGSSGGTGTVGDSSYPPNQERPVATSTITETTTSTITKRIPTTTTTTSATTSMKQLITSTLVVNGQSTTTIDNPERLGFIGSVLSFAGRASLFGGILIILFMIFRLVAAKRGGEDDEGGSGSNWEKTGGTSLESV